MGDEVQLGVARVNDDVAGRACRAGEVNRVGAIGLTTCETMLCSGWSLGGRERSCSSGRGMRGIAVAGKDRKSVV